MITTQQLAAAQTFLAACEPANTLRQGPTTQSQGAWHDQLQAAQTRLRAARTTMHELCGTRAVYQEAITAAREKRKLA